MTNPFLIAHKVRGEPAFDVAIQMPCPECNGNPELGYGGERGEGNMEFCHECDQTGYWWIIPTSGHRAYPYDHIDLNLLMEHVIGAAKPMPDNWPDHYPTRATPTVSLLEALNLHKPSLTIRPTPPIARRF